MDDLKQGLREGENKGKEFVRKADGEEDLSDKLGNLGDDLRQGLGNAGDDLDKAGDRAGEHADRGLNERDRL